ncbi:hypothetical protein F5148DRAFT_979929 [Russula earlei]|uniref:Uncharacterized protein n=1 Tax=Russula earlei TaxID=71964 RepID=A0ACC0U9P6_9AGAM|nr:hypothetical protein F5148DRAFT_979929 [Russula earlei]
MDGSKDTLPSATVQALEQFVKFGRKGKQKEKKGKEAEFPPPSWFDTAPSATTPSPVATDPTSTGNTPPRTGSTTGSEPRLDDNDAAAPEPLTLARRIQTLLGSRVAPQVPTPSATDATTSFGAAQSETAVPATPSGPTPLGPVPITDSRFLALLNNTNAMSGSLEKGRQSVFTILDRLRRPSRMEEAPAGSAPSSMEEQDEDEGDGSVMLYGPIVPSDDSEVELAASDIMSVFDDGESLEFEQPARPLSFFGAGEHLTPRSPPLVLSPGISEEPVQQDVSADARQSDADAQKERGAVGWFNTWKGKMIEGGKLVSDKVTEGTKSWRDKMTEGRKVVKTETRWVPSPDKISLQATWWGYRLYLPPPVLDVLNNKSLEAAKRAAILTTALQWLLGRVPLTIVPPQFRAGLLIAQRLVPYLGYIGGFVAWSWGAMKSFDKGHGIVLTATWLLPVALIPGTWDVGDGGGSASSGANTVASPQPEASTSDSNRHP